MTIRRPRLHVEPRLPYAVCRRNMNGSERWYWQRPGFAIVRLADDPAARLAEVQCLNAASKLGAISQVIRRVRAKRAIETGAPSVHVPGVYVAGTRLTRLKIGIAADPGQRMRD